MGRRDQRVVYGIVRRKEEDVERKDSIWRLLATSKVSDVETAESSEKESRMKQKKIRWKSVKLKLGWKRSENGKRQKGRTVWAVRCAGTPDDRNEGFEAAAQVQYKTSDFSGRDSFIGSIVCGSWKIMPDAFNSFKLTIQKAVPHHASISSRNRSNR
ncbi:hypothetical protein BJ508DRAFT_307235 [Ascobolus immersus RN42]|uniref:Uncharacterized protein n=1 Tax=Ascobolus immersus RN42 TaxID=1160509 RepID=A0A3N4I8T1_ASCIM|nr:hypothetical protein BJ508DRAFT_307235 [Ascobolus immersus RN42]